MTIAGHHSMLGGTRLPYDAEVEYLESTGTQYIDTGAHMSTDSIFEASIAITASGSQFIFGIFSATSECFAVAAALSGRWIYDRTRDSGYRISSSTSVVLNRVTELKSTKNVLTVDGVEALGTETVVTPSTNTAFLFAWNRRYDNTIGYGRMKIFSCKIVDAYRTFDFIPVRFTNENGALEGAMYDRCGVDGKNPDGSARTDGLYRNQGTGAFVIGPDASAANGGGIS